MMQNRSYFEQLGYDREAIDRRIEGAWETLFAGPENQRIYFEAESDMGYMLDTGNIDVRTEGQSYGMMMAVQMNRQDVFDRIWKWTMTYMYLDRGPNRGYFAWSCSPDGTKNSYGPAPDGEEYFALALFFATLLNFPIKGQNLFKGILFFPNLINGVAIGFIFLYFFRDTGTLNTFLRFLGFKGQILWLTDPRVINYSLAATSIWRYMGFNMVMFLGAFQSISQEIYEAAALDGAERWNLFRYIMFPIIKPVVKLNLILSIKGALSVFEIPYIMTGGGNGSSTFVIRTIDTAFKFNKIGLASAMAVVLTIIILLITAIQEKMFKEERYL